MEQSVSKIFIGNGASSSKAVKDEDDEFEKNASKRFKVESPSDPPRQNPMTISLVLEKVFSHFHKTYSDIKNFRLVCKAWDEEIIKVIRSKTTVNLEHIVNHKRNRRCSNKVTTTDLLRLETHLDVPFERIVLNGTCELLKNPNIIKWFQLMGPSLKHLKFHSALNCYHQIRFLECVLKLWCTNLTSLYLSGVKSFIFLNIFSRFDKTPFICNNLKELIIFSEVVEESREQDQLVDCEKILDLEETFLNFDKTQASTRVRIDNGTIDFPLATLIDSFYNDYLNKVVDSEKSIKNFIKGFGVDGGILGQILWNCQIETIIVKGLPHRKSDSVIKTFCLKPQAIASSLKSLQFETFTMLPANQHWTALKDLNLQLSKLCLGPIIVDIAPTQISSLLSSYAKTLKHLEFCGTILLRDYNDDDVEEEYITVTLPVLPNVTTFINDNIFCTRLEGLDFVKKLPKLKKCTLANAVYHSSIFPLNPAQVFNLLFQASTFLSNEQHETLEELNLAGKISYTRHLELIKEWFPGLKKVQLTLDGSDLFVEFFQIMKKMELEEINLSFYSNDTEWCNLSISNNMKQMSTLKFLELTHLADHPLILSAKTCAEGFEEAHQLISLKLTNFGMFVDEIEAIRKSLSKISYVKFTSCVIQHRPVDAEFAVCYVSPFPLHPTKSTTE